MGPIEWIFFGCAVIGTYFTVIAYRSSVSVKETRKIAQEKFDFLTRANNELLEDINIYGKRTNSFQQIFMQGLTLQQCIDLLTVMKTKALTEEHRLALAKSKSKMRLDENIKNLDVQIKHLMEVRTTFDYFINNKG